MGLGNNCAVIVSSLLDRCALCPLRSGWNFLAGLLTVKAYPALVGGLLVADNFRANLALVECLFDQSLSTLQPLKLELFLLQELVVFADNLLC